MTNKKEQDVEAEIMRKLNGISTYNCNNISRFYIGLHINYILFILFIYFIFVYLSKSNKFIIYL